MSLPPLANLFALRADDPSVHSAIEADLRTAGEFEEVWNPAPGWVAASKAFPGGLPDDPLVRAAGLAFAEGRDRVVDGYDAAGRLRAGVGGTDTAERLRRVCDLVDSDPESLDRLPGDFTFLRFRHDGGVTAVRSCAGLAPVYLHSSAGVLAIGTRLGDFVRYLPGEPELDPLVNAAWITGYGLFPDDRTFLRGVGILPAGHAAVISARNGVRRLRYWDPRPDKLEPPTPERVGEHAEALREALIAKLTRDLDPDGRNLLTLSGGVDSSSLLCLACGVVGREVMTLSLVPPPGERLDRERSYIDPLLSQYGVRRSWFQEVRPGERLRLMPRGPVAGVEGLPNGTTGAVFHIIHPALCLLPDICREAEVRVLFGGEFADEVAGSVLRIPDWALHTSLWALLAGLRRLPTGWKDVPRWFMHRLRAGAGRPKLVLAKELPALVREDVRAEYREWRDRFVRGLGRDRRPLGFLDFHTAIAGWVVMNWEGAGAVGVRRSFPFFHREVLELAFACHPAELIGPGQKRLLRRALSGDVRQANLWRPDKGAWGRGMVASPVAWEWGPLPQILAPVLRESLLPEPRGALEAVDASGMLQLLIHSMSVQSRRRQRQLASSSQVTGSDR